MTAASPEPLSMTSGQRYPNEVIDPPIFLASCSKRHGQILADSFAFSSGSETPRSLDINCSLAFTRDEVDIPVSESGFGLIAFILRIKPWSTKMQVLIADSFSQKGGSN